VVTAPRVGTKNEHVLDETFVRTGEFELHNILKLFITQADVAVAKDFLSPIASNCAPHPNMASYLSWTFISDVSNVFDLLPNARGCNIVIY